MYRFDGLDIEMTKGDSFQFRVVVSGRELPKGTAALFSVKRNPQDDENVIEHLLDIADDGTVMVGLSSGDTDLPPRTYYWDIRVMIPLGDGTFEVRTPMEYAAFTILDSIGNAPRTGGDHRWGISPVVTLTESDAGVTIVVTDVQGTKLATVYNGPQGPRGPQGEPGRDGYTPIKGVDYFDGKDGADGYTPVKGKDYFDGKDGVDGHTPVRGTDYFTAADKAEMVSSVLAALPVYAGEVADV